MIRKISAYLLIIFVFMSVYIRPAYAHGVIYEVKTLSANKIKITLKWSQSTEKNGIVIKYFYLKNGKTLYIGYDVKKGAAKTTSMEYDLTGAVPPLRIILTNAGDANGSLFKDIKGIEAEEAIRHLHDAGIIEGNNDGNYQPQRLLSRAEFAIMLVKALKLDGTENNSTGLTDINNHPEKKYIITAVKKGYISGVTANTFRPESAISTAEVSKAISKAFSFKIGKNGIYDKVKRDPWYEYVKKMFDTGILRTSDSIYKDFNAEDAINRANCAIMLSRALSTY